MQPIKAGSTVQLSNCQLELARLPKEGNKRLTLKLTFLGINPQALGRFVKLMGDEDVAGNDPTQLPLQGLHVWEHV